MFYFGNLILKDNVFQRTKQKKQKTVALFVFLMLALKSHKKKNRLKMVPSYRKLNRKYQLHMKTCFLWTFAWNRSKHFREIVCIKSVRKKRIITNMVSSIVTTGSFVGFFFFGWLTRWNIATISNLPFPFLSFR